MKASSRATAGVCDPFPLFPPGKNSPRALYSRYIILREKDSARSPVCLCSCCIASTSVGYCSSQCQCRYIDRSDSRALSPTSFIICKLSIHLGIRRKHASQFAFVFFILCNLYALSYIILLSFKEARNDRVNEFFLPSLYLLQCVQH